MNRPLIFKRLLKNESEKISPKSKLIKVLFVGTSENRWSIIDDIPDLPDLLDESDSIIDPLNEKSNLECYKIDLLDQISNIFDNPATIKYMTVDPAYGEKKREKDDDPNYMGHVSELLENLETDIKFDIVSILGCYPNFFSILNINKIDELLKESGRLIIQDNIPYKFNNYFKDFFVNIDSIIKARKI